jgi:hypothetical protein
MYEGTHMPEQQLAIRVARPDDTAVLRRPAVCRADNRTVNERPAHLAAAGANIKVS